MLKILNNIKNNKIKINIGDEVNIYYRFKGVFFLYAGFCISNKKKTISLYCKKKQFYAIFTVLKKNVNKIKNLHSYYFNNLKFKLLKKNKK